MIDQDTIRLVVAIGEIASTGVLVAIFIRQGKTLKSMEDTIRIERENNVLLRMLRNKLDAVKQPVQIMQPDSPYSYGEEEKDG